ncbi:MAG: protein kinase domain-containing protein [Anaerostipes sp.]|jgi:serine/threonine protein kinase|uniref:protein kinase domain-containing protein n=1 Tax=Lachnospiraceae TaxID=186803 RepID=UPI000E4288D5|nr:protein kinase [Blautia sp. AM23-13AC]MBS6709171.1 protein kinase [Blautia sp.]RGE92612.1 hypothetical protein DW642_07720 [Blautia sp. AM23-13AC]HJH89149.1 protein kinase [Fusicatenibacter saccharivorans]
MQVDRMISEIEEAYKGWKIGKRISTGSSGTVVYEINRNYGCKEENVIKIVTLLEERVCWEDMTEESRRNYETQRKKAKEKAVQEVALMYDLKTCENIVGYLDYGFLEISDTDGISYVLTIRMFKYKDLDSIAKSKVLSESDIIKIGMDVCNALEACERKGIMHRDIKPGNIFYAEDKDKGKYLLADFGISRIVEKGDLAHTYQGTWQFAAPEQFDGLTGRNGYDHRVDIYSLGLTLYYLANNQKFPSCNRYREEIAPIEGVNPELNRILLKACALSAGNRYSEASEMKTDLQILYQAVGKKKGTKRVSQFDSQRYETESAKPEIKNYATDYALLRFVNQNLKTEQALRTPEIQDFTTESAIAASGAEKFFTQRALKTAEAEDFSTQRALKTAETEDFSTQRALKTSEAEDFSTQRALKTAEAEDFSTQRALKTSEAEDFSTQRALKTSEDFSTQRALRALETENFSTQKALKISRTENFAASGRDSLKSQNGELGSFVASMDTEDVPMKGKAEENDGYMSADRQLSEQDIRMNAVAEMKKGNNEQAFQYYAILAEKEDWEFMYHDTTELFESEQNILRRSQDAVFWFTKCAEFCQDSWTVSLAEFQLGEMYAKGIGVKKNYKIAEKYYRSSAEKGNPYAKKKFVAGRYVK